MILDLFLLLWRFPFRPDSVQFINHRWGQETCFYITPESLAAMYHFEIRLNDSGEFWIVEDSTGAKDSVRVVE